MLGSDPCTPGSRDLPRHRPRGPVADPRATAARRCRRARASRTCPAAHRARPPHRPRPITRPRRGCRASRSRPASTPSLRLGRRFLASAFLSPKIDHREAGPQDARRPARFRAYLSYGIHDTVGHPIECRQAEPLRRRAPRITLDDPDGPVDRGGQRVERPRDDRGSSLLNPMYLYEERPGCEFIRMMPRRSARWCVSPPRLRQRVPLPRRLPSSTTPRWSAPPPSRCR